MRTEKKKAGEAGWSMNFLLDVSDQSADQFASSVIGKLQLLASFAIWCVTAILSGSHCLVNDLALSGCHQFGSGAPSPSAASRSPR